MHTFKSGRHEFLQLRVLCHHHQHQVSECGHHRGFLGLCTSLANHLPWPSRTAFSSLILSFLSMLTLPCARSRFLFPPSPRQCWGLNPGACTSKHFYIVVSLNISSLKQLFLYFLFLLPPPPTHFYFYLFTYFRQGLIYPRLSLNSLCLALSSLCVPSCP